MSAGLSLRTGISAGYSPMTPPAAMRTTDNNAVRSTSIAQQAYGVQGTGVPMGSSMPAYGAVGAGIVAVAILVYMWWSLPR